MLQRIQTIWLLLAATCGFLSLKFPFFSGSRPNDLQQPAVISYLNATTYIPVMILTIIVFIGCLIIIFLYKNRKLQLRLTITALFLSLLTVVLCFLEAKKFVAGTYSLSALLFAGIPVFLVLAARGMYKDEKLVRSLDRLR